MANWHTDPYRVDTPAHTPPVARRTPVPVTPVLRDYDMRVCEACPSPIAMHAVMEPHSYGDATDPIDRRELAAIAGGY